MKQNFNIHLIYIQMLLIIQCKYCLLLHNNYIVYYNVLLSCIILYRLEVKLLSCIPNKINALSNIRFRPFVELQHKFSYNTSCPADAAWLSGWLIKRESNEDFKQSNWKGYMKSIHKPGVSKKSFIDTYELLTVILIAMIPYTPR